MKTGKIGVAVVLLICLLSGCGAKTAAPAETVRETTTQTTATAAETTPETTSETKEVIVFAAASMTETLEDLAEQYKSVEPNVKLTFNFDSSGTLKTQIEEGAPCDLFISAGQKQMNQLDMEADPAVNADGLDFVDSATRVNLLENKVALCVPEGNPKAIHSYDDLVKALQDGSVLMAMGNSDVPVGQYTQKLLTYFGLDEAALAGAGCLTYGSNVKEVTTQISEGTVDCGVIYQTDACSAGLTIVDTATEEMCGQVIYPAAVLKNAAQHDAAQAFLDYLRTAEAGAVFEQVGFTALQG